MYICYLDESGVVEPVGTSHFTLLGLAIPIAQWKQCNAAIQKVKLPFNLQSTEIHAAWMARRYLEQEKIPDFGQLSAIDRRAAVEKARQGWMSNLIANRPKAVKETKKNFRKTAPYIHLTHAERRQCLRDLVREVSRWTDARLFAEVVHKQHFFTPSPPRPLFEHAFTQVVQRFEYFLRHRGNSINVDLRGILVQDNNDTIERRLTALMHRFHVSGTPWSDLNQIVETPFFVDSELTDMVQIADLCAYATRRFVENKEVDLFNPIYGRFDRAGGASVGIRHFTSSYDCSCRICSDHTRSPATR